MSLTLRYSCSEEDKSEDNEDPDISKIKKVQSFFRGWLCRLKIKIEVSKYKLLCDLDDGGNKLWKTIFGLHTLRACGKETGG